jgi:Mn2+/Fe2+ NRAMP family transporter
VAATGVGAGDLISAGKAGAEFGLPLLWTAAFGAVLKFVLAEGVARWQLATGTTLMEGWTRAFGWPVRIWFLVYLVVWTFVVAAALLSACGLAAHALVPSLSVNLWAALHGVLCLVFVLLEGYGPFERVMKWAIGAMFLAIVGSAALRMPDAGSLLRGLAVPSVPGGSLLLVMGAVGGVGGTVTLLSYAYWMREKGWSGREWLRGARFDLAVGYVLTGIFGVAIILLAGQVLFPRGIRIAGSTGILDMAGILGESFGRTGELVFLVGFWAAVATSALGVWQGVPYLFAHIIGLMKGAPGADAEREVSTHSRLYRGYLLFMTFPPMLLFLAERPVFLVVLYAALGSIFMPFLAVTLLVLNNKKAHVGALANGPLSNLFLVLCVALFAYLAFLQVKAQLGGG